MRYRVLGPLEVTGESGPVEVKAAKQRILLAVLLTRPGSPISIDRLADAMWEDELPSAPERAVSWHVHKLRRQLGPGERIAKRADGYLVEGELDSRDFEELYRAGLNAETPSRASEILTDALKLWRGPAFGDLAEVSAVRSVANRLNDLRASAIERRVDADLALGRHDDLVGELTALVGEHAWHEGFRYQLMIALYRSGRQADALQVYRDGRERMVDELGIEPGNRLRALEQAILRNDPELDAPTARPHRATGATAPPVPAELPATFAAFTGRDTHIARIVSSLTGHGTAPRVCVISGGAGVGKSTLAIHAAQRLAHDFPDGQLYVNLRGATLGTEAVTPREALNRFLRSLNVTFDNTMDADELSARFRSVTASKRLLVVLDDARDAAQVKPLMPGGSASSVLITSRRLLPTLDNSESLPLDGMSEAEAVALLARLLDDDRIAREPEATSNLTRLCAGMPLALSICAARLKHRPQWSISGLVDGLTDANRRLSELEVDDMAVRVSFQVSYRDLADNPDGAPAARAFRYLGLHDGADIGAPVAAALFDTDDEHAERLLTTLTDVRLAESHAPGRYRMHDLLRLFARELTETEDTKDERDQARIRMWHRYLADARGCVLVHYPSGSGLEYSPKDLLYDVPSMESLDATHRWGDEELPNIAALCHNPPDGHAGVELAVALSQAVGAFHSDTGDQVILGDMRRVVCERADTVADPLLQLSAHANYASSLKARGQLSLAFDHYSMALDASHRAGREDRAAGVLAMLAGVCRRLDDLDGAEKYTYRSLELGRKHDWTANVAAALTQLGLIHEARGNVDEAIAAHTEAVDVAAQSGNALLHVGSQGNIAYLLYEAGRLDEAIAAFNRVLESGREHGLDDSVPHADHLWGMGLVLSEKGDIKAARDHWNHAAAILHSCNAITESERITIETSERPQTPTILT